MFEIEVPKEKGCDWYKIRVSHNKPYDNQPYYLTTTSVVDFDHFVMLEDDLHEWFKHNNIGYSLKKLDYLTSIKCIIVFQKKSDAVLFKLSWNSDV